MTDIELTRRELLKALGGGILVLAATPDALAAMWAQRRGMPEIPQEISAWIHIAPSGKVTVFTGKVEVGQNARTSVTQAAAEELRLPPAAITVTMGDTDLVPFDMGTFGSRTTPTMIPQVRRAAAAARETLVDLAAQKWGVDRSGVAAEGGQIQAGGHTATYGEIAAGQPLDKQISNGVELTDPGKWKVLGTPLAKVGAVEVVTGRHEYASDMKGPGMLYGKVLKSPTIGGTLAKVDTSKAAAMDGVIVIHEGDFVGVAAPTLRMAEKALASISAEWREAAHRDQSKLFEELRGAEPLSSTAKGAKTLTGRYTCEFIAHVPLEPRAAFATWERDKLTVYTGTQRPFAVKDEVVQATGLPPSQVRVIVPDTGSGYGGKHTGEAAVEAAKLALAKKGRPVRVVWTREEEFRYAYFRPAGVADITSGVDAGGKLTGWTHDNYNSGGAAVDTAYDVADRRCEAHEADTPLRQGSYRSLAACFNNFARETHMDELAIMLGHDPLQFRLANIANPRLKAVLEAAADRFGWGAAKPPAGHGVGIACGTEKGSYIATAAEVEVKESEIRVVRAVNAYECGAILNPALLLNQVEGAVIMGLGGALFEKIEYADGKLVTDRLSAYRVPRYRDVPKIETVLLDRKDLPSVGAGETPIICIAPAIGNAVFNATGKRLRSMPLTL